MLGWLDSRSTVLDQKLVDGVVNGIGRGVRSFGESMSDAQTGWVRWYGLVMIAGTVGVVMLLVLIQGLL